MTNLAEKHTYSETLARVYIYIYISNIYSKGKNTLNKGIILENSYIMQ